MAVQLTCQYRRYFLHALLIWLLGSLFMFSKNIIEVSPSVMTGTLMRTFHIGGVELGNLAACYFYAYLLLQLPAGLLLDRFGPRKITTLSMALCGLGCLLFAEANHLFVAEIGRFLSGAGAAFAAASCFKLIANWFAPRHQARMAGLMMTIAMLGAVGGQAPLNLLMERLEWRPVIGLLGMGALLLGGLFWLIVRDHPSQVIVEEIYPRQRFSLKQALKEVLQNSQSWWLSIYSGFAFAPMMVFGGMWGVSFMTQAFSLSTQQAAEMISLLFIGFAVGAPFFGFLSDKLGQRKSVMMWGSMFGLMTMTMILYLPFLPGYLLAILLFFAGFSISSFFLCFTMMREIHIFSVAATAIGFMNAFDALLGAISDPLTGLFLDWAWTGETLGGARVFSLEAYRLSLLTIPIYLGVALIALTKVKETRKAEAIFLE